MKKRKIIQWLMILSLIFPLFSGCGGVAYADDDDSVKQGTQISDLLGYWSGWAYKGISDIQKNGTGKDNTNNTSIRKGFSGRNAFMVWSFMSPGSKGTGSSMTGAEISFTSTNVTYKALVANMPGNGKSKYLTNDVKPMFMYRYVLEQNGLLTSANNQAAGMFANVGHMIGGALLYVVVLADSIVQSALKIVLSLIATLNPFVGIMYITGNSNFLQYVSDKFTDKSAIEGKKGITVSNIWGGIAGSTKNGSSIVSIYKALVALMIVINTILLVVGIGKAIMGGGKDAGGNFGTRLGQTIWKYLSRITIIGAAPILIGLLGALLIEKVAGIGLTSVSTQTPSIIYGNFVNTEKWAVNSRFALPDTSTSGGYGVSKGKAKHSNSDSVTNLTTRTHLYASANPSNLTKQYVLQLNAKNAGLTGAGQAMSGKPVSFKQTSSDLLAAYMSNSTFSRQDLDGAMIASISKDKKRAYDDSSKSIIGQDKVFTYGDGDLKADNFQWYLNHLTKGEITDATNGTSAKTNAEKVYNYTYGQNADDKKGVYNSLFISDGGLTIGKNKYGKYYKQTQLTSETTGKRLAPGTNSNLAGLSTAGAMNLLSITKSNSGTSYTFPVSMVGGQTGATSSLTRTVSLVNVNNGWEGLFKIILIVFKALFSISITVCVLLLLANVSLRSVMDTFKNGMEILRGDIKAIQILLKDLIGTLLQMLLGFMLIISTNTIDDTVDSLINHITGVFVPSSTAIVNKGIVMGAGVSTAVVCLSYVIQAGIYFWLMRVMFKNFNNFMRAVAQMFDKTINKMGFNPGDVNTNPVLDGLQNGTDKLKDGVGGMIDKMDAESARKADLDDKLDNIDDDDKANDLKKAIDNGEDKNDHGESEIAKKAKEKSDKLKEETNKLKEEHQDLKDRLDNATNPDEIDDLNNKIKANEKEQAEKEAKAKKLDEIGDRAAKHKEDADKAKSGLKGHLKQKMNPNYADAKATYAANMRDLDAAHQKGQLSDAQYAKAKQALKDEYLKQTAHPLAKSLAKKAMAGGGLASEELLRRAINNPNGRLAKALDMATDGKFSEALKNGKPLNREQRQNLLQDLAKANAPLSKMTEAANSFVPKDQAAQAAKNFPEAKADAESVASDPQEVIDQAQAAIRNGTATDAQQNLVSNVKQLGKKTAISKAQKAVKNGTATEAQKALAGKNPEAVIAQAQKAVKNGTATDLQKDIVREVAKADSKTVIEQAKEAVANGTATETQRNIVREVKNGETQMVIKKAQEAVANGTATNRQKEMIHELSKMPQALTSSTDTMKAIKSGDKAKAAKAIIKENQVMLDQAVKEGRTNDAIAIMKRINNEASQANIDVPQSIGHTEIQKMIEDVGRADAFIKGDMISQPAVGKLAAAGIAPTSIHKVNVPQSQNTVLEAAFGQRVHIPKTGGDLITNEMIAKAPPATRAGLQEMQKNGVKIQLTGQALKQKPNIAEVKNAVIGLTTGYQGNPQQALGGLDQRIVQAQANGENITQVVRGANIKTLAAGAAGVDISKQQAQTVASYQTPAAVLAAKSVTTPTAPIDVDLETAYQLHGNTPSVAAAEKAWGKGGSVLVKGLEQGIAVKRAALKMNPSNKKMEASLKKQEQHLTVLRNMAQSGSMPITQEEVSAVAEAYQAIDPSQTQSTIEYTAEKTVQVGKSMASSKASSSSSVAGASKSESRFLAGKPTKTKVKTRDTLKEIQDAAKAKTTLQAQHQELARQQMAERDSIFNPFRVNSNPEIAKYEMDQRIKHANDHNDRFARAREEKKKREMARRGR